LINRATDNLMRLVTVRPVGDDVRGDTAEARVARAEAALDKGDLASAVAELDQLEGRPAAVAADWLGQAKARLGADQAVAQLRAQATDLLSQSH
ncbi:MAG: mitofilin family membrane protein, partial [Geminicoccaceae bacterium]